MKRFNVTGTCIPKSHYMVDTTDKLVAIKQLVDREEYFTIKPCTSVWKNHDIVTLKKVFS